MTAEQLRTLLALEGRTIALSLAGGRRIDECVLVSVARGRARTLWVDAGGVDELIDFDQVLDAWEVPARPARRRPAA